MGEYLLHGPLPFGVVSGSTIGKEAILQENVENDIWSQAEHLFRF